METDKKFVDAEEIKRAAQGRWPSVLEAAGLPSALLNKKHQPCPACGGKDRFRFTDHGGNGTWICNQCEPDGASPFKLMEAAAGYTFPEACQKLGEVLGLVPVSGSTVTRKAKPLPAPVDTQDEERAKWRAIVPVPKFAENTMNFSHAYRKQEDLIFKSVFRDEEGRILGGVARFRKSDGGKIDLPYTFCENVETGVKQWRWHGWETPRPLFGLDALAAKEKPVLVVEGEKCKLAADHAKLPFAVVTWHGGCNNWNKADWSAIQNRRVILWPDCDSQRERLSRAEREAGVDPESKPYKPREEQGGYAAMAGVGALLLAQGCTVHMVNIPKPGVWPHGYDIADALSDGGQYIDPHAALSWQGQTDWLVPFSPSEKDAARLSPAPLSNGVPAENSPDDENALPSADAETGGEVSADEIFKKLLADFALIEGKTKAFQIKTSVEWSKPALISKFGKDAVQMWFDSPRKKTFTQNEVGVAKKSQQRFEAENNQEMKGFLERYVYLDGTSSAWDTVRKKIVTRSALQSAIGDMYNVWLNSPARRVAWFENLVFAPGEEKGEDYINTFEGIPMQGKEQFPVPRDEMPRDVYKIAELYPDVWPILKLLHHLCNGDRVMFEYTLNWVAYPLQNIGAKMATALVFHGETQGAGKTLFFGDIICEMYGDYGATLGQKDLESQYTGSRSQKLFVLFEEIFNNKQKYDNTGAMKHMITGKTMRIEKKFIDSYEEANHVNCVFLSNELQPFKIEENDRRYFVVCPEKKLPDELSSELKECLSNGGMEKFYSFLLSLPLYTTYCYDFSDPEYPQGKAVKLETPRRFDAYTPPPMTAAKARVIAIGRAAWQTFYSEWRNGDIPGVPYGCCLPDDLFAVYNAWARKNNEHTYAKSKFKQYINSKMYLNKKWYRWPESNKPDEKRQITLFYPKDMVVPHGTAEMDHIGRQVGKFQAGMRVYCGVLE